MKLLIKNGEVVNPRGLSGRLDVLIEDGKVAQIDEGLQAEGAQVIDAAGMWVMPGLIDMHCHLREPGFEHKEDVQTGLTSAVCGGFTAVACMPNTKPVIDTPELVAYLLKRAKETGLARLYPIASITKGLAGQELTDMEALQKSGAVAFSDDGKPVPTSAQMRDALLRAKALGTVLSCHCEDLSLIGKGACINEGRWSKKHGLVPMPRAAEEIITARDVLLAEHYGARVHIDHVSTRGAAQIVRAAKARGVQVTAETGPHYFSATDDWAGTLSTNAKMSPPLRTADDVAAIKEALRDGTIDAIATDHAPHAAEEKALPFPEAPLGIVGFETAFSLAVTTLVLPGVLTKERLVETMSGKPADILGVPGGVIREGGAADITIADPEKQMVYTKLHSKSWNSPFLNKPYTGSVTHTIVGGHIAYALGEIIPRI